MEILRSKKGFICDMDGVIYHGNKLLPGVKEFVDWLYREEKNFLFLTNSSERSPKELQIKLARMGLEVDESHFYTSALATATLCFSPPDSLLHLVLSLSSSPTRATAFLIISSRCDPGTLFIISGSSILSYTV